MNKTDKINWICEQVYPGEKTFNRWQNLAKYPIPRQRMLGLKKFATSLRAQLGSDFDLAVDAMFRKYEGHSGFISQVLSSPFLDEHEASLLLSGGKNRSTYDNEEWYSRKLQRGYPRTYDQVRRLIARSIDTGILPKNITPTVLLAWYEQHNSPDSPLYLPTIFEWGILEHVSKKVEATTIQGAAGSKTAGRAKSTRGSKSSSGQTNLLNSVGELAIGAVCVAYGGNYQYDCTKDILELLRGHHKELDSAVCIALLIDCQNSHLEQEQRPLRPTSESSRAELPTKPDERVELLQKIVAAIAKDAYGYDPKKFRQNIAKIISSDLETIGMPFDEDTVRKHLKEGARLLGIAKAVNAKGHRMGNFKASERLCR